MAEYGCLVCLLVGVLCGCLAWFGLRVCLPAVFLLFGDGYWFGLWGLVMFGVDLCRLVWFCLGLVVVAVG